MLVSDNEQNTIMRTVNFTASGGSGGGGDDGGSDDGGGGDDGGGSGDGGDDGGGTGGYITVEGYSENSLTVYYTDGTSRAITKNTDNMLVENSFTVPANNKIIESIALEGGITVIAGRKADGSVIALKLSGVNLAFRDAVEGYIPIGTYSEFQLINTARNGSYRQEADIDLLNIEWTPIGNSYTAYYGGTFDGDDHTLTNLKISGNSDYAGLFGHNRGTVRNVHIISGLVSGKGPVSGAGGVGGVCGYNYIGSIFNCSNACLVSGENNVGGVCGYNNTTVTSSNSSNSSSITSCHNTGLVSGSGNYIGGVCGYSYSYSGSSNFSNSNSNSYITSCYNTGSVSGGAYVGGVCGYNDSYDRSHNNLSSSIIACYNTGSVSGTNSYVGGVCGYSSSSSISQYNPSSSSIIACYNTGSVSGSSEVGGVCGFSRVNSYFSSYFSYSYITACYNTGSVSGSSNIGGVCGYNDGNSGTNSVITACYWKDITGDNADYGTGMDQSAPSNTGTSIFALGVWPVTGTHQQWGTGDGSGDGKYWKTLGGWYGSGGNPAYPKLWFED
jgi:hypothetical protein